MRVPWIPLVLASCGSDPLLRANPEVEDGNRAYADRMYEAALDKYEQAERSLPENAGVRFNSGTALLALGRADESVKALREATKRGAGAEAHYNLGNAHFGRGRFAEAIEAYRRALRIDPEYGRAKWNLELALQKKKQEEESEESADRARRAEPDERGQGEQSQDEQGQDQSRNDGQPEQGRRESGQGEPQPAASTHGDDEASDLIDGELPSGMVEDGARADHAVLDAIEQAEKNPRIERLRALYRNRRVEKDW